MNVRDLSSASLWRSGNKGYPDKIHTCGSGLRLLHHTIRFPKLNGKKMLFVADIHLRKASTYSLSVAGKKLRWSGAAYLEEILNEIFAEVNPDYFIFGGDLVAESVWMKEAFRLFTDIPCPVKIAIPGNWDIRRRRWMPHQIWQDNYKHAGFHYLVNKELPCNGIVFYGLDDYKIGNPAYHGEFNHLSDTDFHCVLSHNPDSIPRRFHEKDFDHIDLILCGHTHGGQLRLPFFGALKTSSRFGKKFEYGRYINRNGKTEMLVTSGIGATFIPIRFLCPPEAIVIEFIS